MNIPSEILSVLVHKKNSVVCKLWREIWYHKTTSLLFTSQTVKKKQRNIRLDLVKKFRNILHLELDFSSQKKIKIDISLLKSLTQLQSLIFNDADILTDAILISLTNLVTLKYSSQYVTGDSLKYLTKLSKLSLSGHSNCDSTGNLTTLTKLSINERIYVDHILPKLINLTDLNLTNNEILNSMLKKLINIKKLSLSICRKILGSGIKTLTNLTSLKLRDMSNITETSLKNLTNLTKLKMCDCLGLETFDNLIQLEDLTIIGPSYVDGIELNCLTNLKKFHIVSSQNFEHTSLRHFTNLTDLCLYECNNEGMRYRDIRMLTNLTNLKLDTDHFSRKRLMTCLPNLRKIIIDNY
jgi:hypothetical protein